MAARIERRARWRHRVAIIGSFVVPLLIAGVALLLVQQVRAENDMRRREYESQQLRTLLVEVLSSHQDLETGSRGFVITGNPAFLDPYYAADDELARVAPEIRRLYAGEPDSLARFEEIMRLSARKQAFSAETVRLRQEGQTEAASARVASQRGKMIMDRIRLEIGRLNATETTRLDTRLKQSNAAIEQLRISAFVLLIVLTVLLALASLAVFRLLRVRDEALSEAEDLSLRREAILQNAMDGIVTLNPSGTMENVNVAMLRMFGYSAAELERRDLGMLFAHRPAIGQMAQDLRAMGLTELEAGVSREYVGLRQDGTEFPIEAALSATILNEGLRYVAVIRDVTERKRVEQLKAEFVSTVSHELRTPLTSIAGSLGLLAGGAGGSLPERAERLITIAHGNAERLVRLINDILDIEKIESGRMPFDNRDLDLKALAASCIAENQGFADKFGVTVALSQPDEALTVHADRDRLTQVVANLLSNACKFSPRGGTVEVALGMNGPFCRLTVSDEGPGIPDEFRDRIFGKFAQADGSNSREKGGTGLGLSIVREIVLRLDGRISFDSEPGTGSRFHVDLPAVRALSATPPPARPVAAAGRAPCLLVCGNGAGTSFSEALRRAGYDVTFVHAVAAAHELLDKRSFDGVIVDMGLDGGKGIEIIRLVRETEQHAGTPILALGGRTGASEFEGDAALVLDWLRKPFEVGRLVESVDAAAREPGKVPRILHIEDDPDVVKLVATALEGRADVDAADGLAAARAALGLIRYDLVIVDLSLADGSGIEILPDLRRESDGALLPVVIFSAQDTDPETAGQVDAFLTKARTPIESLVSMVETLIRERSELAPEAEA